MISSTNLAFKKLNVGAELVAAKIVVRAGRCNQLSKRDTLYASGTERKDFFFIMYMHSTPTFI